MKPTLHIGLAVLLSGTFWAISCKKSEEPVPATTRLIPHDTSMTAVNTTVHPYPVTPTQECAYLPNYGDSIVYPQPASGNYYVYPTNTQGIQGTYLSWPAGLIINATTGTINVTQSQTGQRFDIGFVQYGTTDTCVSQLIIAGTAYMDSVYVLAQGNPKSAPYFNANPAIPSPCQNGGSGCQFDYYGFAKLQGIAIDKNTGIIDLQNTADKIFGKFPVNGATVNTTIVYKLNDKSNKALQQISLQLMYYNRKANIPPGLLATITARRNTTINNQILSKAPAPTRPPIVIIVRAL